MTRRLFALALALLTLSPAGGQDAARYDPQDKKVHIPAQGSDLFRYLMARAGMKPSPPRDDPFRLPPAETAIVVWGSTQWLDQNIDQVKSFLNRGGQLLVLTDFSRAITPIWTYQFGLSSAGGIDSGDPGLYYGKPSLPFVVAAEGQAPANSFAEAFAGFGPKRLVANLPGSFSLTNNPQTPRPAVAARFAGHDDPFFAVELRAGRGRALFIADQSMFVNEMLHHEAFDNKHLAWKIAQRLAKNEDGQPRSRVVFIEDGQTRDRLELPGPPPPDIPFDMLANMVLDKSNDLIAEAQERDLFNKVLEKGYGHRRMMRALAVLLGIMAVLLLVRRWLGARGPVTPAFEGTAGMFPSRGRTARSVVNAMVEQGDLASAARQRVRLRFEEAGLFTGHAMPSASIRAGVAKGRDLKMSLDRVIYIGWGRQTFPVGDGAWREFNRDLDTVIEAGRVGDWYVSGEA